ncbi:unnamed protein product [Cylindrotheca closterium]|uniref:DUF6824 domain-containing protein n=1 Tax=Cylindrotheca closterium TaxID=2856 RepID=A0AAD2CGV0_9STRA|nr:unnamed protein product [Cylindrotheca closterium]
MGDSSQFVTSVNTTDVLFGRGSGPNDHEGNIRFRDVVSKRKAEYMSTNHRQTKATIAKDVVNTVYSANGRFLKKLEANDLQKLGFPPSTEVYQIVDDDTVMEKAKQALRQNREKTGNVSPKPAKKQVQQQQPMAAPPAPVLNNADFAIPNFAGLASHDMLEPLPIPAPRAAEHARPQQNPDYAKYTQQLEGLAAQQASGISGDMMRRGNRRGSVQSLSNSKRDSLQLSQIMYPDGGVDGMSAMMESFKGMSTTEGYTSQDSIGTIENMFGDPQHQMSGISNMSLSSVFNEKQDKSKRPGGRMSFTSTRSREALGETADWVFDEQSPSADGGAPLWPLEESRNSGAMLPPANRPSITALMSDPLQESQSGAMMSTGDIGMSTGSLMMTSIDSLGPLEEKK